MCIYTYTHTHTHTHTHAHTHCSIISGTAPFDCSLTDSPSLNMKSGLPTPTRTPDNKFRQM